MTDPDQQASILIVEDDQHIRTLLRYFLQPAFDLEVVASVDEALGAATRRPFDLFLLDVNLGERRTGADLLDALRAMPAYHATPAVACTAYALDGDRERFLDLGFDEHLDKPFTRPALLDVIHRALAAMPRPTAAESDRQVVPVPAPPGRRAATA